MSTDLDNRPPPLPPVAPPRRFRFRERVYFRVALVAPLVGGILFAPDRFLRVLLATSFLLNFLSAEDLLAKIRKL